MLMTAYGQVGIIIFTPSNNRAKGIIKVVFCYKYKYMYKYKYVISMAAYAF